jgi:hypothetical protein
MRVSSESSSSPAIKASHRAHAAQNVGNVHPLSNALNATCAGSRRWTNRGSLSRQKAQCWSRDVAGAHGLSSGMGGRVTRVSRSAGTPPLRCRDASAIQRQLAGHGEPVGYFIECLRIVSPQGAGGRQQLPDRRRRHLMSRKPGVGQRSDVRAPVPRGLSRERGLNLSARGSVGGRCRRFGVVFRSGATGDSKEDEQKSGWGAHGAESTAQATGSRGGLGRSPSRVSAGGTATYRSAGDGSLADLSAGKPSRCRTHAP